MIQPKPLPTAPAPWTCEPIDTLQAGQIRSPILRDLYELWTGLGRAPGAIPLKASFRPNLAANLLPNLMMIDVIDAGRGFTVRVVGSKVRSFLAGDSTGNSYFDDDPLISRRRMCQALQNIVQTRLPHRTGVPASNLPGMDIYAMEGLGLPLSRDSHSIDYALVGMVFTPRQSGGPGRSDG